MNMKEKWKEIEDKWYSLLDNLEDKGIPVYRVIDPLEDAGIPSLPLVLGVLVILILGLAWMFSGTASHGGTLNLAVISGNKSLQGASVSVFFNGRPLGTWTTGQSGQVTVNIPSSGSLKIEVTKSNCETIERALNFSGGVVSVTLKTNCGGAETKSCLAIPEEITSVPLNGANGQAPKNCKVYLVNPDGTTQQLDWQVVNGQLIIGKSDCLTKDEMIRISCDGYSGEFYPDEILDFAEAGEPLQLTPTSPEFSGDSDGNGIPDWEQGSANDSGTDWGDTWGSQGDDVDDNGNGIPDTSEQDIAEQQKDYMALSVSVYDKDTDAALSGIEIRAVDGNGTVLPGNQTDVVSEDGIAVLRVPRQTLSLQAIDPNNVYGTLTTPPFYPTGFTTLRLTKGWPTTIWVKQPDGRGVPSAAVVINKTKIFTDSQGKAVIALTKGNTYTVYAYKNGYKPASTNVLGGSSANLTLEKLTENNSAPLTIQILNPTRMDDPFPNVKVKLVTSDGLLTGECTTPASGKCSWGRVFATKYDILAKPPLAYEYTRVGTIDLKPGMPVLKSFEVEPVRIDIRVRTLVDGKPTDGARLTLYRVYPDIEKVDQATTKNSYANFKAYWGNDYYITGVWMNGTTKLYGTIGPFKVYSTKDFVLNLQKPKTNINLNIQGVAKLGSRVYGKLDIGLPYLDENRGITYKQIIVEIWSGKPGDKSDPALTPVLLDKVPELVKMSETSQVPKIGIMGYSEYTSDFGGRTNPAVQTSKGLKIVIENYKPGVLQLRIPFLVRLGALANNDTIHYRAIYVSGESKFATEWKTKNLKITGKSNWHNIPTGDFYLFKSGLTLTPNSTNWQTETTATVDSIVYLHLSAIARDYSDTGRMDFNINPDKLEPLYFWGKITNGTKTWSIDKTDLHGNSFDVMRSTLKRKLAPDDKVYVTVALEAKSNGSVNIMPFYREYSDENSPPILTVHIKNVSWTPTPIPNVEGNITGRVHFTMDNIPTGYKGKNYWGTFYDNLPLFSKNKSVAREFRLIITLKNSGSESYTAHLSVTASGNGNPLNLSLDYPTQINIPKGTTNIIVNGIGPEEPTSGKINVWLWQETKPQEPWVSLKFQPNDYFIVTTTNNTIMGKAKQLTDMVTKFTTSGYIQVLDADHKVIRLSLAKFGEAPGKQKYVGNGIGYYFTIGNLKPGQNVDVEAKSEKLDLVKPYVVQGAALMPEPQTFSSVTLTSKTPYVQKIAIINYWNKELTITPTVYDLETNNSIASGLGNFEVASKYYNISLYATKFDKNGKIVPPEKITHGILKLAPHERAVLYWSTSALGSAANDYKLNEKLQLELDANSIQEIEDYFQNFSANLPVAGSTGEITGDYTPGNYSLRRSTTEYRDIDYTTDCQADLKNGILEDAEICDSSQMAYLIRDMINKLSESDEKAIVGGPYAIGNDKLSLKEIDRIVGSNTKINHLVVTDESAGGTKDEITCGILNIRIVRNKDKSYDIYGVLNPRMPWCYPGQPSFFIGLINPDAALSGAGTVTMPYTFDEGSSKFQSLLADVMKSNERTNLIWGYSNGPQSTTLSKNDFYTIKWIELSVSDIGPQSEYSWLKDKMGNHNIIGFVRWYPPTSVSASGLTDAYVMGIVTSDNMKDKNTINAMEKCFVANLAYHWLTGNSSYINETNITSGVVIPLDSCKMPEMDNIIQIPAYKFSIYNKTMANITGQWTNNNEVWIKAESTSNSNIGYCYAGVERIDTSKEIPWSDISGSFYSITGLKSGENTILLKCIGSGHVAGPVIKEKVYVDLTKPVIVGKKFISLVLGRDECCKNIEYNVSESGSGLSKCWVVYGKLTNNGQFVYKKGDKINDCIIKPTITGEYNAICGIGSNQLSIDLPKWNGTECVVLPVSVPAGIVCEDKVGNIGVYPIIIHISGSDISIEPIETGNECPTLLNGGELKFSRCLFTPAGVDLTQGSPVYYTSTTGTVTMKFNVTASTPNTVSCTLQITNSTKTMNYYPARVVGNVTTHEGATYIYHVDIGSLGEGEYNVKLICTAEGSTSEKYEYVGNNCEGVPSQDVVWDSSKDGRCATQCV